MFLCNGFQGKHMAATLRHPLVMVITGNGKGKTTSAFGQVLRAVGRGWRCLVVQFVKAEQTYGEVEAARTLAGVEVHSMGLGFLGDHGRKLPLAEHRRAALEALAFSREKTTEGDFDLLVLDEVNFALSQDLLGQKEILAFLRDRHPNLTVILTGRGAPAYLIEAADLVSEVREIKHPYTQGIKAQKGIEF